MFKFHWTNLLVTICLRKLPSETFGFGVQIAEGNLLTIICLRKLLNKTFHFGVQIAEANLLTTICSQKMPCDVLPEQLCHILSVNLAWRNLNVRSRTLCHLHNRCCRQSSPKKSTTKSASSVDCWAVYFKIATGFSNQPILFISIYSIYSIYSSMALRMSMGTRSFHHWEMNWSGKGIHSSRRNVLNCASVIMPSRRWFATTSMRCFTSFILAR